MSFNNSSAAPLGSCRKMSAMTTEPSHTKKPRNLVSRGRFFIAAVSFLLFRLSLMSAFLLVCLTFFFEGDFPSWFLPSLLGAIALLAVTGLHIVSNGRSVSCPLCRASLFMSPRNLAKPGVPKILGSTKTPLAFSLLKMPTVISCPCCAERVRLTRRG